MHEFDLSTRDPAGYTPIIRRVFFQSNSAIWPSKTVEETHGQLDELCTLLNVSTALSDEEKIAKLRQVDDMTLVKVLAKMDMHTFRATRDEEPGAFVKADWTRATMDGRFAKWCSQQEVSFLIGECADEQWVYRYINTPKDEEGLIRQVNNYYTLPLVEKMLPWYGVSVPSSSSNERRRGQQKRGTSGATRKRSGERTLYETLGVKPSATSANIRTAYLAQVRLHHPDKLQQQQQSSQQEDPTLVAAGSDDLIRQLNHAYKTLTDDTLRAEYNESLATSRANASASTQRESLQR